MLEKGINNGVIKCKVRKTLLTKTATNTNI